MVFFVDTISTVGKGLLALATTVSEDARLLTSQALSSLTISSVIFDSSVAYQAIQPVISTACESPQTHMIAACAGAVAYPVCSSIFSAIRPKRKRAKEENVASPKKARSTSATTLELNAGMDGKDTVSKEGDSIEAKDACTNEESISQGNNVEETTSEAQVKTENMATVLSAAPVVPEEKKIHEMTQGCVGETVRVPIVPCVTKSVSNIATGLEKGVGRAPVQPKAAAVLVTA